MKLVITAAIICAAAMLFLLFPGLVMARDNGQWEGSDPAIRAWYQSLMQPDNPNMSCCGESDAYWADKVEVQGDKVYAIITDDRPDEPLGRKHVPVGTKILVPSHKITWRRGNPTGHIVIFLRYDLEVYCYVQNGGV